MFPLRGNVSLHLYMEIDIIYKLP